MDSKTILVAGATGGIGREVVRKICEKGDSVIATARNKEQLQKLFDKDENHIQIVCCDVEKDDDIAFLFNTIKKNEIKLDGMVYTTGICFKSPLKQMNAGELEKMFRINAVGFYEMCRYYQSAKISNKQSSIVGISSYAAELAEKGMSAYAMTKAAMNTAAKSIAAELVKRKIRVNTLMPAIVQSKMKGYENDWTQDEIDKILSIQDYGVIPISQVVEAIMFLLSDESKYITGECITVGAGYHR